MMLKKVAYIRKFCTQVSKNANKPFFVTTPIFYVNASPHIGHLYSAVISDAVFRFENMISPNPRNIFSTGTDEHGTKIQQAAAKNKIPVSKYCDNISSEYELLFNESNIRYTDYIRTTQERHKNAVKHFWNALMSTQNIYSTKYSGWYCIPDETFLPETQVKEENGQKYSIESGHAVEWTEETNYMFKLSHYQNDIIHWIKSDKRVTQSKFEKILLGWLEEPIPDISISRPATRVHWGIKVPDDESQTIYVWLDALINYLTVAGYPNPNFSEKWPPSIHVLGKDILKFHGIYWPGFLLAAGLEPPKKLLVHSHWTVNDKKMSKSKLNVVNPLERAKIYTCEGVRYFLLREGVAHSDGNYSDTKVLRILNAELADTLGNLLSRCCGTSLNLLQVFPELHKSSFDDLLQLECTKKLIEITMETPDKCFIHYKTYNFHLVVDQIISVLHVANNFVETTKPWELKKLNQIEKLNTVISLTLEVLRITGILLQPIIPQLSETLLNKLNVSIDHRKWVNAKSFSWNVAQNKKQNLGNGSSLLFPRIILDKDKTYKKPKKQNTKIL